MAETWRRLAEAGERLGLTRPSYQHVRRLVRIERRRRQVSARQEHKASLGAFVPRE